MPIKPPYVSSKLPKEKLKWLEEELSQTVKELYSGGVGGTDGSPSQIRRSEIFWIQNNPNIKSFLMEQFSIVNRQCFGFDIKDIFDIQYSEYDSKYKGHYDWHLDIGEDGTDYFYERKLSMSIQLSDYSEYKGGNLEIKNTQLGMESKQKGTMIVFPSNKSHRVTPVTEGTRKALVAWVEGL
jgi:PKHD-type hydroxylase